jgi:hypothetical protein
VTETLAEHKGEGVWKGDRKVLWHALAIIFIVVASTILFYKFYYQRGLLMHVDMTFPTSISRNLSLYAHTWWPYGSVQNIWNTQRVFWSVPLLWAVKLLGLSTSQYLLILFVGTFALAGVSMYALAFKVIGWSKVWATNGYAPYIGAVFAALIFMYNPWSVSHLWPYFGYPGYAVLPLVFILLYKAVDSPRPRYVVTLALLISVTSTGPIIVVWFWTLILTYLLFDLTVKRFSRESLKTAVKVLVPLGLLYALLNAMWILPVGAAQLSNKPFIPIYPTQLNQATLDMLSSQNTVVNNLRFTSGWMQPVNPQVSGSIWVILSFALPVLAVVAMIVLRKKIARDRIVIYWSMMFLLSILLATGSAFILRRPYSYFALRAPGVASYGWVFRVADRWLCFAPIFYALVLGLLVASLLGSGNRAGKALAAAVVVLLLVSFGPTTLSYARTVYNPTKVPADYDQVNAYIEKTAAGARPIWMPFSTDGFHYYWAPEKRIRGFDVYSSNPNLNNFQDLYSKDSFYYWLESLFTKTAFTPSEVINADVMLPKGLGSRLFLPFSARYLVLDSSVPGYRFGDAFDSDSSMKLALKTDILKLFELKSSAPFVRPAVRTVAINTYYDELALIQKLSADELQRISFSESGKPPDEKYGVLNFSDYSDYYDINSGFEVTGAGGLPLGWTLQKKTAALRPGEAPSVGPAPTGVTATTTVSTETSVKSGGSRSLRIENRSPQDLAVSTVNGPEVAVTPGDIYTVQTSIKYQNSKWTHVLVEGYEKGTEKWVTLVKCPAVTSETSSNWKKTDCSFYLPAGFSKIRPVLVAGWEADSGKGPAVSWFDDVKLGKINDGLYSDLRGGGPGPAVKYQRVSQEKYRVSVKGATEPFVLVFGEAFDPLWVAKASDGKTIDPVRLYNVITGFPVDRKGSFEVTIEYMPQRWFQQGLAFSLAVYLACACYLAYDWRRRRSRSRSKTGNVRNRGSSYEPSFRQDIENRDEEA